MKGALALLTNVAVRAPEIYRVASFNERGDHHVEHGLVVGHVHVRQNQARANH